MLTPHFNVQQFTMNDYNNIPVTVNYQFKDPESGAAKDPKEYRNFFDIGQKFPVVQQLKFDNKEGLCTLKIDYSDSATLMNGLPQTIAQYEIGRGKRSKADVAGCTTKLAIRVKNNANQIPELERVEMTEHWTEEQKIPIKTAGGAKPAAPPKTEKKEGEAPAADGAEKPEAAAAEDKKEAEAAAPEQPPEEQKFEIKQRKKERTVEVPFKTVSHAIPPDMKKQFLDLEAQLMIEDRKILDLKEAKYNLESFTYEMKNGIDQYGNFEHFIDPSLKSDFLANLLETEQWIYADGENAPLDQQMGRLTALQAVGNPIKARWRFRNEFEDFVGQYQKFKTKAVAQMAEVAHLTDEQRNNINDKCGVVEQFFMETRAKLEQLPKHEDPPCTLADLDKKNAALEAEVYAILNAPPPKKEEEKKEEAPAADGKPAEGEGEAAAAGSADAEMKDEGKDEAAGEPAAEADK